MHRLEHVCHVVEHGEWPAPRRYKLLTDSAPDSRSSTPNAPGTPAGEYSSAAVSPTLGGPSTTGGAYFPFSFAGVVSSSSPSGGGGGMDREVMLKMMAAREGMVSAEVTLHACCLRTVAACVLHLLTCLSGSMTIHLHASHNLGCRHILVLLI